MRLRKKSERPTDTQQVQTQNGQATQSNQPNTYAFIDSQNLNLGTQKMGWKMDWRKFRRFLHDQYGVTKAYMFIGYIPENEDMYVQLHDSGYLIVLKPTQDMSKPQQPQAENTEPKVEKPEDKKPVKGNIDAELVLWAMKEINHYQKAIIVSGDGDFYCLLEYLDEQKKLSKILVPNRQYSSLFNKYQNYIVRLDQLRSQLSYRKG
ncbi:MAG TPA: NYN domain-containing protein [Patescibacteria group bacterium]|nr:NYN domain-containing protein [Patescibacteria group bacterium]